MNEVREFIEKIGKSDTSGKWMQIDEVEAVCTRLIKECIAEVSETGRQCAYTTRDVSIVECTIEKSVNQIKSRFGL